MFWSRPRSKSSISCMKHHESTVAACEGLPRIVEVISAPRAGDQTGYMRCDCSHFLLQSAWWYFFSQTGDIGDVGSLKFLYSEHGIDIVSLPLLPKLPNRVLLSTSQDNSNLCAPLWKMYSNKRICRGYWRYLRCCDPSLTRIRMVGLMLLYAKITTDASVTVNNGYLYDIDGLFKRKNMTSTIPSDYRLSIIILWTWKLGGATNYVLIDDKRQKIKGHSLQQNGSFNNL